MTISSESGVDINVEPVVESGEGVKDGDSAAMFLEESDDVERIA
jgi:hypothetical protein